MRVNYFRHSFLSLDDDDVVVVLLVRVLPPVAGFKVIDELGLEEYNKKIIKMSPSLILSL